MGQNTANINQRLNGIVTTSGLMNFWDNVICFLYRHLVNVCSNDAPNGVLMYWSASTYQYQYVTKLSDNYTNIPSETKITAQDMLDMLKTLKDTYNFAYPFVLCYCKCNNVGSMSKVIGVF